MSHFLFHSCLIALSIISFTVTDGAGLFTSFSAESLFSAPCLAASFAAHCLLFLCVLNLTHAIVHFFVCHAMFSSDSAVFNFVVDLKLTVLTGLTGSLLGF